MLERLRKQDFPLAFTNPVCDLGCPPSVRIAVMSTKQVAELGVLSVGNKRPTQRGGHHAWIQTLAQEIPKLLETNAEIFPSTSRFLSLCPNCEFIPV